MPVAHDPASPSAVLRSPSPEIEAGHSRSQGGRDGPGGEESAAKRAKFNSSDVQRKQLEKLLANPDKEVAMPKAFSLKPLRAPSELQKHVTGSSSGAGSGEFHVYKQSRRREYERLKRLQDDARALEEQQAFIQRQAERDATTDAKTAKNRARRQKRKAGKSEGGKAGADGVAGSSGAGANAGAGAGKSKFGSSAAVVFRKPGEEDDDDEDEEEVGPVPVVPTPQVNGASAVPVVEPAKILVHDDD